MGEMEEGVWRMDFLGLGVGEGAWWRWLWIGSREGRVVDNCQGIPI